MPPNMAMQPNPNVMMKPQDLNLQMQAQQQTSTMKIENVSLQSAKKVSSQIMFNKGMVSSPNINAMSNNDKGPDMGSQMGGNPMNLSLQQQLPTLQATNSVIKMEKFRYLFILCRRRWLTIRSLQNPQKYLL